MECPNTCGSAVSQISERLEEDAGQSIPFDTDFTTVVKLNKEPKKFGEDLVSKLKGRFDLKLLPSLDGFSLCRARLRVYAAGMLG